MLQPEAEQLFDPYLAHAQGWWLFGLLLELAVIAAVVVVAALVVQRVIDGSVRRPADAPGEGAPSRPDEALTQLRLRYARGEVSREEYLRAAEDLGSPVRTGDEARTT